MVWQYFLNSSGIPSPTIHTGISPSSARCIQLKVVSTFMATESTTRWPQLMRGVYTIKLMLRDCMHCDSHNMKCRYRGSGVPIDKSLDHFLAKAFNINFDDIRVVKE